jgi:hypothetical protein
MWRVWRYAMVIAVELDTMVLAFGTHAAISLGI